MDEKLAYATIADTGAIVWEPQARRWAYRPVFILFFAVSLSLPFLWVGPKLAVGTLLIGLSLAFNRQAPIRQSYYLIASALIGFYSIYVLGPIALDTAVQGSPIYTITLYVVFSAFWLVFLPSMSSKDIGTVAKIAAFSAWAILIYALAIMASAWGILPFRVVDIYSLIAPVGIDANNIGLASSTLSALLFTAPILTYLYLSKPTFVRVAAIGLFWLGVVILGRRSALLGLMVASALVLLAASSSTKRFINIIAIYAALTMAGISFVALDVGGVQTVLTKRIDQFDLVNEPERIDQTLALLEDFKDRPMFGHGLGTSTSVIRNDDKPWRYEMSVPAALFRYGVIGYGILWVLIGFPLLYCIRHFRKAELPVQALICGSATQFCAYLVNPVFDTFDTAFQFFLPVFLASYIAASRRPRALRKNASG